MKLAAHDRAVPPVQNLRKGLLSSIKITLSDDDNMSSGSGSHYRIWIR